MSVHLRAILAALSLGAFTACAAQTEAPDNAAICNVYAEQGSHAEVVAGGTIEQVLGTRRGPSGDHEGYLLKLHGGCDLLLRVETNVDLTGPVPLQRGEKVIVKGEYEFEPLGGVLHWTHRDPRGRHIGGYVVSHGKVYD